MFRVLSFLLMSVTLVYVVVSANDGPGAIPSAPATAGALAEVVGLPVGLWSVQFANDVSQTCEIRRDGNASAVEPRRSSRGTAMIHGRAIVILFEDDRVERWTPVGNRIVVEHWAASSLWPTSAPVLGIAERIE